VGRTSHVEDPRSRATRHQPLEPRIAPQRIEVGIDLEPAGRGRILGRILSVD
jgi:hypothetical protein